jgi:hydroxylamine dehydrogenase
MFLEHRMRTFQRTFHANPDYALWYGWSKMQQSLTEIKEKAADLREKAKAAISTSSWPSPGSGQSSMSTFS